MKMSFFINDLWTGTEVVSWRQRVLLTERAVYLVLVGFACVVRRRCNVNGQVVVHTGDNLLRGIRYYKIDFTRGEFLVHYEVSRSQHGCIGFVSFAPSAFISVIYKAQMSGWIITADPTRRRVSIWQFDYLASRSQEFFLYLRRGIPSRSAWRWKWQQSTFVETFLELILASTVISIEF